MWENDFHLSVREKLCYAVGDAASNIAWRGVGTFLFIYYTDVVGLLPAAVGTLFLVARIADGVIDVLMGNITDRTETRWGKYRPWMLWSALPLGIALSLLFSCPSWLDPSRRIIYAYATYLLFFVAYAAQSIPYGALLAVLSPDDKERTSAGGYKMSAAFAGGLVVQALLVYLKDYFGNYSTPIYLMSAVMTCLLPITFFGTRERVRPPAGQRGSLRRDLGDLFLRNRPWLMLFLAALALNTAVGVKIGVTMTYFAHYLGNEKLCATYLTVISLASIAGAALTPALASRLGKRAGYLVAFLGYGVMSAAQFWCGAADRTAFFTLGSVAEAFSAVAYTLSFVMLGDATDYSEFRNGRRATGLVFSAMTFAMKAGGGLGGLVIGVVLARCGYNGADAASIAGALGGIKSLMSWIPALITPVGMIALAFYPLTTDKMNQISAALAERRKSDESQSGNL